MQFAIAYMMNRFNLSFYSHLKFFFMIAMTIFSILLKNLQHTIGQTVNFMLKLQHFFFSTNFQNTIA